VNKYTKPKESSTRKKIDIWLKNLGWDINEESPTCNVFTERTKTKEQEKKLGRLEPDYVLYKNNSDEILAIIETKKIGKNLKIALEDGIKLYASPLNAPIVFATDGTFINTRHIAENKELTIDNNPLNELVSEKILLRFIKEGANIESLSKTIKYTRTELIKIFEWANNLLRKEGLRSLDRFVEFSNILFLKLISEIEKDKEETGDERVLAEKYCWDTFKDLSADAMYGYINNTVLPYLVNRYNKTGDVFQDKLKIKKPETLKAIIDKLSPLPLINTDSEIKGDAFEYFLKSLVMGNDLGEYFTPRHIVRIMVKLIDPKFGETVYDPACGTGGFLIEAFKHIKKICKPTKANIKKLKYKTVYGIELTDTARIAKMNMILTGDGHTNIKQYDSLENPIKNRYDVVFTNFPFSQDTDFGGLYGFDTKDANPIFIKHIIDSLNDGGRAGVVTFQGVLYDSKSTYKNIRKFLLENCNLEAIIKLHNFVFRPYAGVHTSILIFKKGKPTKKVWFFKVDNDGFKKTGSKKGRPPIKKNDLDFLETIWSEKENTRQSWSVDIKTIQDNNYILDADLHNPYKDKKKGGNLVKLLSVADLIKNTVSPFEGKKYFLKTGNLFDNKIKELEEVTYKNRPNRANLRVKENDVLFAKMENTNKNLLITKNEEDIIVSTGFIVLRTKDKKILHPEFLRYIVSSDTFLKHKDELAHGSTQRAINETKDLQKLKIPVPPNDVQKEFLSKFKVKYEKIKSIEKLLGSFSEEKIDSSFFKFSKKEKLEYLMKDMPQNGIYKPQYFYGEGTPIIRINNIYDGEFITKGIKRLKLTDDKLNIYRLNKDDIILNRVNSEEYIGKCCVYNNEFPNCVFESNMMRFSVDPVKVHPKYIVYFLSSEYGREQILSKIKRAVNQVSINQEDVISLQIPMATLEKQNQIVAEIDKQINVIHDLFEIKKEIEKQIQSEINRLYKEYS